MTAIDIHLKIDFSGITFLPSHSKGSWIEISILKNQQLIDIQNQLLKKINKNKTKIKIKSGIGNKFRPHITLAKINNCKIDLNDLDYFILRKKEIKTKLVIGYADSNFEFYKL